MTTPITAEPEYSTDRELRYRLEHHFAQNFDSLAYPLLADIYLAEGDLARARKVCTVGLEHHPGHPPGLFLLATVALRGDNLKDAETLLLQTLSSDEYHLEAAELLVAVQERLRRKKSILEQAYRQLLHANPLSRGARSRLKRLQAERELVRGVKDELKAKRGAPTGSEMEDAQADELQTIEPAEPIREMWAELEAEAAGPVEAPATREPIVELPEVDEAEQNWETKIKRLAAMMSAPGGPPAEYEPMETPFVPEAAVEEAKPAEVEAPSLDTAASLLQEPGAGMEQKGEPLDTLEAEEKIDEAPGEPGFGPAEEEAGPESEVLDTLALAGEGEVAGSFVAGIAARDDEAGPEVESPFAVIPEGEKPEDEPFKPEATPLRGDAAALEDELVEVGPLEGLPLEDKDTGPLGEVPDSESLLEGEPESEGGDVEVSPAESRAEEQEAFEPGARHLKESGPPAEDFGTVPVDDSAEEEELFEPGVAITSEEAPSIEYDLSTDISDGQEAVEEQVWPGAVPTDEGTTGPESKPGEGTAERERPAEEPFEPGARHLKESGSPAEDIDTVPVNGSAEEEELFEPGDVAASEEAQPVEYDLGTGLPDEQEAVEEQVWPGTALIDEETTGPESGPGEGTAERERQAGEPFEPGTEPGRKEGVKSGDEGVDARAFDERKQEEPYRPDVESLQRAAKRENELIEAVALAGEDTVEDRPGAPPLQKEGDEEDLYKIEAADKDTGKEPFEPGTEPDREEEVKPEDKGIDQTALKGRRRQEEPYQPDVESLQRETEREDELARAATLEGQDLEDEGAVPFEEITDSESFLEGEPESEGGDVEVPPAECRAEEQEAFEPGARHLKESGPPAEDIDTVPVNGSAEEEELFEPGDVAASEEAPPVEYDLGTGLPDEQEAVEEQVWPGAVPADERIAGLGEGTEERERPAEELFEPGAEPAREEEIAAGEKGLDRAATESEDTGEEPAWSDVSPPPEQTTPESVPFVEAALEEKDLAEEQALPGEETDGGSTTLEDETADRVTLEDKDLEREPFEPGGQSLDERDEAELGEAALEKQAVEGETREEEPYQPDVESLQREIEREDELARAATLEGQGLEDEGDVPFEEMTDSKSLLEGEPESEGGDVEVPPAESRAEEREAFEPGARHLKESGPPAEDIDTVPVNDSAEEEELFEPGDVAASEEAQPVEEDLGTGLPDEQEAVEEQVWPGAVPADEGIAGLGEGTEERERPAEELFEPGAEPVREEEIAAGEKDLDRAATESEDTGEEPAWPDVSPPPEQTTPESVPFVEAALEEKDLAEEQALPGEETDGGSTTLEDETADRVTLEDKDLERVPFEPGGQSLDEGDEAELGEATQEEQAVEGETREEEPYRPDVDSLQKEAEQELEIIDRVAHDGNDMPGELFEPSVTLQKEEALSEPTQEQDQPAAGEAEPEIEELDEGEYEFESEFQAAEEADSRETLGIDPRLATFTLATIYKVQGLYHQALQVLDLLEAKGGDLERIQAERDTILQLMTTGTSLEPE